VLKLILSGPWIVGSIENGNRVTIFSTESHGKALFWSFVELRWQCILVRRRGIILSGYDGSYVPMSTLCPYPKEGDRLSNIGSFS
jgi:hypothetical protein